MSPYYAALSELDERARFSRSMPELDAAFLSFVEDAGFSNWSAILVQTHQKSDEICYIGRPNLQWAERYLEKNYADRDAVVRVLYEVDDVIWWSKFCDNPFLDRDERRLFGEARDYGIAEGVSTAVRLSNDRVWMCAMTGAEPGRPHRRIENAFQFAAQLYVRHAYRFQQFGISTEKSRFTSVEIDILRLLKRGLTRRRIAEVLGKAPSTVYNQIASAKSRLGVGSTQELLNLLP